MSIELVYSLGNSLFIDDLSSCGRGLRGMEGRLRRNGTQVSPEGSKVWTEPLPKHQKQRQQGMKVPVVYYLCKNRHLEHPHFIEVPSTSRDGLYLRDVTNRLVALRGKRMPTLYSWSCKRNYKNGFVWQDLSEDDLILPAHGNEYILKGSELLDQTPPDCLQESNSNSRAQNHAPPEPEPSTCSRDQEASSFCSSPASTVKEGKSPSPPPPSPPPRPDNLLPPHQTSSLAIESPSFRECRVFMQNGVQDASTQTEDSGVRRTKEPKTQNVGLSTDNGLNNLKFNENRQNLSSPSNEALKETSPWPTPSNTSSVGKTDTLESLIRAEVSKLNSFRIINKEEVVPMKAKMKKTNAFLRLITCGSTLVKDHHSFWFIPSYKPRFSNMRLSPSFPSSMLLRELDHMSESSRVIRLGQEEKDIFTRCIDDNYVMHKEEGEASPTDNCYSFDNGHSDFKSPNSVNKEKVTNLANSEHSPPPSTNSSCKQAFSGKFKSPIIDTRNSLAQSVRSFSGSKRMADVTSSKGSSSRTDSFEEKDGMIKIEERLTSGAWIVIQSRVKDGSGA